MSDELSFPVMLWHAWMVFVQLYNWSWNIFLVSVVVLNARIVFVLIYLAATRNLKAVSLVVRTQSMEASKHKISWITSCAFSGLPGMFAPTYTAAYLIIGAQI